MAKQIVFSADSTPVYICVGKESLHFEELEEAARKGGRFDWWNIKKTAKVGDLVVFYLKAPISAFVATGIVDGPVHLLRKSELTDSEQHLSKWIGHHVAYLRDASMLSHQVSIESVREKFPKWGWAKNPRSITSEVPSEYVEQFLKLLKVDSISISTNAESEVDDDIEEIKRREARGEIGPTTRKALIDARKGQGRFRKEVLARFDNRCAVTGCRTQEAIRASHIKPWKQSSDQDRLDSRNGLPLVATLDALFDENLIAFDEEGDLIVSSLLSKDECSILGLLNRSLNEKLNAKTAEFLEIHRGALKSK